MIKILVKRKRRHMVRLRNVWTPDGLSRADLENVLEATATPRLGSGRSGPLGWDLATGTGRTVSLISSLIHVRVPASITVYYRALNRVNRPSWSVLDGHP
jgi:hypothetical protein